MPQRIFAPAVDAIARGQDIRPFAFTTALQQLDLFPTNLT